MVATTLLLCLLSNGLSAASDEIREFTGSRTRIAWCQDVGRGNDSNTEGSHLWLMGLDTDAGSEERPIIPKESNYYRPLITPSGRQVIYTNLPELKVYVVDWDGSGLHEISPGVAEAVWRDPTDGVEWVYVRNGRRNKRSGTPGGGNVDRFQINQPQVKEPVWRNSDLPLEDFNLSADGTKATGSFPWPICGVADLKERAMSKLTTGCWPSMCPDNSYRSWVFDGSHRSVWIFQPGVKDKWKVVINDLPELRKHEVYHPRWSNHPQFMCMTGPYRRSVNKGGTDVEIYLGKFDADFHAIEKIVRVTHNERGDFFPAAWIESASHLHNQIASPSAAPKSASSAPQTGENRAAATVASTDGLVFWWENGAALGQLKDPETKALSPVAATPRGAAIFGRHHEMDLSYSGSFVATDADHTLLAALTRSNELSIEALIVPARSYQREPRQIITFSSTPRSRNFSLAQDGDELTFRIRTTKTGPNVNKPVLTLCKLKCNDANHVIVTYKEGRVVCFLNGRKVADLPGPTGDFSNWSEQHLVFGDGWLERTADWSGKIEGIAIYSRALGATEASGHSELCHQKLAERSPVEQIVVHAKLLAVTPPPSPESIKPYRRALVVNDYEVQEIISDGLLEKKFQGAHWGVLDAEVLSQKLRVGTVYELTLEKYSEQPQLEGERLVSDSEDFGLPLYYVVKIRELADNAAMKR